MFSQVFLETMSDLSSAFSSTSWISCSKLFNNNIALSPYVHFNQRMNTSCNLGRIWHQCGAWTSYPSLEKIFNQVTQHDLWIEQKDRPVQHALFMQLQLLHSSEFLIGCLPKLDPSSGTTSAVCRPSPLGTCSLSGEIGPARSTNQRGKEHGDVGEEWPPKKWLLMTEMSRHTDPCCWAGLVVL
jgi:hypothetical protein